MSTAATSARIEKRTRRETDRYVIGSDYVSLLDRYPLLPVKDQVDYDRATSVLHSLFGRSDLTDLQRGYLDTLILQIQKYEDEAFALDTSMSPVEALRALMDANGLRAADLVGLLGGQSNVSMILAGKRAISRKNAVRLADRFRVDVETFIR